MKKFLLLSLCALLYVSGNAQSFAYTTKNKKNITEALNLDGTINTRDFRSGAFNAEGYKMDFKDNGKPVFYKETGTTEAGDENWDPGFATPGVNGQVFSVLVDGNDVYVGGTFSKAGGLAASNIAKWNGAVWSNLGAGIGGTTDRVTSIKKSGTNIYAASLSGVSKWDGTSWSTIGTITNPINGNLGVNGIDIDASGNLYAIGYFITINGVTVNGIAKWNGTAWSALGNGIDIASSPQPLAVAVEGTNVYIGGGINSVSGVSVAHIARWNGSSWSSAGGGITGTGVVYCLAVMGTDVYAGGNNLTNAGGVPINNIAKWNGSSWTALGNGLNNDVLSFTVSGTDLYVGGMFTQSGSTLLNKIAKWNGSSWSNAGNGLVMDAVYGIGISPQLFFAGGITDINAKLDMHNVARWNGSSWAVVGNGTNDYINCIAIDGNNIYIGGKFIEAGGLKANRIAKWDGVKWDTLGGGFIQGEVYDIAIIGNKLYAGGSFLVSVSSGINYLSVWDGNNWAAVGTGVNYWVFALAVNGTDLYAGGNFSQAGGITCNNIAKWNGSTWSTLANGTNNIVKDIKIASDGTLYAGGNFTVAGTTVVNRIAKWNGTNWSAMGSGVNDFVNVIAINGSNEVYIGGQFDIAINGGIVNHFAKFNGTAWVSQGGGVGGSNVYSLVTRGNEVYVGGDFLTAGTVAVNNIAKWDGSSWSKLGAGLGKDPTSYAIPTGLAINCNSLYAVGYFATSGDKRADRFARYWMDGLPSVNISTANTTVCSGTAVSFNAVPVNGGTTPNYQWQVNGTNAGTNSNSFTTSTLANNAQVKVILSGAAGCINPLSATSNIITMTVNSSVAPSVTISTANPVVCAGASVTFNAVPINGGATPAYQWQVNGINAGTNSNSFTTSTLANNAQVKVILSAAGACSNPTTATSNIIAMTVNAQVVPSVSISGNTTVNQGVSTLLTAVPVNGGSNPLYSWEDSTNTHNWQTIAGASAVTLNYTPALTGDKIRSQLTSNATCATPVIVKSNVLVFSVHIDSVINPGSANNLGIRYYPNPVRSVLVIDSLKLNDGWQSADITSLDGKKMIAPQMINNRTQVSINVARLPAGQYVAVLRRTNGKPAYLKFIKE